MSTIPHHTTAAVSEQRSWTSQLLVPEMWASLAITVMWLAVLLDAVWGPNIVSDTPGGTHSSVPSAVPVALFAFLATWVVAKYGFEHRPKTTD
jgi:hypothetical protein